MTKRFVLKTLAAAALAGIGVSAQASSDTPLRILVGFAPGGNVDTMARMLAEELRPVLGRSVLVENRPGAGGRVAAQALKTLPADGSVYLFSPDSWAIFPTITLSAAQLRYNYFDDMAPVARVVSYPLGFFASAGSGITSVKDYAEKVKKDPNLALYGSSGAGSITEFLGILMSKEFGATMTVVPFKGANEVKTMLMGGQVSVGIMSPSDVLSEDSKSIRPLGFFADKRWAIAPHIPTLAEQGINVTHGSAFMGMWASSKTPANERLKMQTALQQVLERAPFREKLARAYLEADFASGEVLDQQVRGLIDYWRPVVEASGFKPQ